MLDLDDGAFPPRPAETSRPAPVDRTPGGAAVAVEPIERRVATNRGGHRRRAGPGHAGPRPRGAARSMPGSTISSAGRSRPGPGRAHPRSRTAARRRAVRL